MNAYVDRIAIWQSMPADGLSIRKNAPGIVYYDHQNVAQVSDSTLVRYAKNYQIKNVKNKINFSLFILTPNQDQIEIEAMLDDMAKSFEFDYVKSVLEKASLSDFVWTDKYYERSV